MKFKQIFKLIFSVLICFVAGWLGSGLVKGDFVSGWYDQLNKPVFTPPGYVFGIVWTILYLMMGISVFLVWNKGLDYPRVKAGLGLFLTQLILNAAWTPLFFGYQLILPALIVAVLLVAAVFFTAFVFRKISTPAAVLLLPYLVWGAFAVVLNGSICYLNPGQCLLTGSRGISTPVTRGFDMKNDNSGKFNELTPEEREVIINKGTEAPFSGKYYKHNESGVYVCKRCEAKLFTSDDKFESNCGWPSFDDSVEGTVETQPDADGVRTEIICRNCGAHLGHIFTGERLTSKNTRYCVNSISLNFIPSGNARKLKRAYFAGGCFWGVEYFFRNTEGVKSTRVGYMGGDKPNPTHQQVCSGDTGHAETLEVVYDSKVTDFEKLAKLFFEIHDPTQVDRQGPDVGSQYRSAIFYTDDEQKEIAEKLVGVLKDKGYNVTTRLERAGKFWEAEDYHQQYYEKKNGQPYCHAYKKIF